MLTGIEILFALSVAVFSITVTWLLTDEGMIFEKPFLWLRKHLENTWFWYPLGGCPKCFAGQVMFWVWLYLSWNDYDLLRHIFITTWAIFFTWLFMRIYTKYNNNDNNN